MTDDAFFFLPQRSANEATYRESNIIGEKLSENWKRDGVGTRPNWALYQYHVSRDVRLRI